jgi:hypothetical protein
LHLSSYHIKNEALNIIKDCWSRAMPAMASQLLEKSVCGNQLVDLDWSFGVTAATDERDQVGKTYLQLRMTINYADTGLKDVYMELSLDQFYHFLGQMESCKSVLDFISPLKES